MLRTRRLAFTSCLALAAAFSLSATGCDDASSGGGVGDPCAASSECASGLRCSTDNECETDPSQTTSSTTGDVGGDGSGIDGTAAGDTSGGTSGDTGGTATDTGNGFDFEACATVNIEFTPVIPTVILLVDRSGSMVEDFGGVTRWEAVQNVLFDGTDGVVTRYEDVVDFGLVTYVSDDGFLNGMECPMLTQVDVMQGNASAMADHMAGLEPFGDTPTGESVLGTIPIFQAVATRAPKVLLLATDGEPDTCEVPDPQEGQGESVAAVQEAHTNGIRTFALSVGDEVGDPHLQDIANAGIGNAVGGAEDAPFWKANDPAALSAAVAQIVAGARPCVFTLNGSNIDLTQQQTGVVQLNGSNLAHGTDWEMFDSNPPCFGSGQCIELKGDACQAIKTDPEAVLNAGFPCEAAAN